MTESWYKVTQSYGEYKIHLKLFTIRRRSPFCRCTWGIRMYHPWQFWVIQVWIPCEKCSLEEITFFFISICQVKEMELLKEDKDNKYINKKHSVTLKIQSLWIIFRLNAYYTLETREDINTKAATIYSLKFYPPPSL